MQWEVEVTPGHMELLNGTIQEAYEQARQINPDFTPPGSGKDTAEGIVVRGQHEKRGHVTCGGFKTGVVVPTLDGVRYLRRITGKPHNQPGPRYCTRVSCSWKSAIWWCNDVRRLPAPLRPVCRRRTLSLTITTLAAEPGPAVPRQLEPGRRQRL